MGDVFLFPENKLEALAFLYVQNQDLSGKTPEELLEMYNDALQKIRAKENISEVS